MQELDNDTLERAIKSNDPVLVALAKRYLELREEPIYSFTPRPDNVALLDQQASFVNDAFPGLAVALGGTASGKTQAGAFKVAKFLRNTYPPRKHTPFWVVSQNLEMAASVCWAEKLSNYITPDLIADITWHNQARNLPNAVILKPHRNNKNWVIEIKSFDMDRKRLQAASVAGFWADEAAPHAVIVELLARCRDYNYPGSKLYTLTPLIPTPELRDIYERQEQYPDWRFYRLNSRCNTALAKGFIDQFLQSEIAELRETRLTGAFSTLSGQYFHRQWFKTWHDAGNAYALDAVLVPKESCKRFITVDLAISVKTSADYTVAQVWDVTPHNHLILLDEWRVKAEGPEVLAGLQRLYERYKPELVGIEDVAYQMLVVQMLRQAGLPVKRLSPQGKDKLARSTRAQAKAESGQVWLPQASWVNDWIAEIVQFPHGSNDDRGDCLSYAAILSANYSVREVPAILSEDEKRRLEDEDKRRKEREFMWRD